MTARLTQLENGLRIVTEEMDGLGSAAIGVWVDVGTRDEPEEINGVAHLLEHMAFKGTATRDARQIAEEIENVGGHLNAYTSREHTAYYAKVLREDAPLAIDLLADILQHSAFDPAELDRERSVILQEIGQALDTPDDLVFDIFQERAYPDQALGRPVLGREDVIRSIASTKVASYMSGHYAADRMVLSAAGALDHDTIVAQAAQAFGSLPRHTPPLPEPGRYQGGGIYQDKDLEQVHLVLGFNSVSYTDPDYYAVSALSTLLGGGMSSRLFQEIREKRGLVYSVYSFNSAYHDGGVFGIYAGTGEDEVAELVPVLCDELLRVADSVTEEEMRRVRAQLKAGLLMGLESSSSRAEFLATNVLIHNRVILSEELTGKIEAIDGAAMARAARRVLTGPPTVAALGPIARIESFERISERLGGRA